MFKHGGNNPFYSHRIPRCIRVHVYPMIYLYIYRSIYLSTYLSIYLPIYLSTYLPVYVSMHLCIYWSICIHDINSINNESSIYLPTYLSWCVISLYITMHIITHTCAYVRIHIARLFLVCTLIHSWWVSQTVSLLASFRRSSAPHSCRSCRTAHHCLREAQNGGTPVPQNEM